MGTKSKRTLIKILLCVFAFDVYVYVFTFLFLDICDLCGTLINQGYELQAKEEKNHVENIPMLLLFAISFVYLCIIRC